MSARSLDQASPVRQTAAPGDWRRWSRRAALLSTAVVAVGTASALSARTFWIGELAASLRWQLGWLSLVGALAAFAGRAWLACALLALLALHHLAPEGALFLPRERGPVVGRTWVLASANLRWGNADEAGFRGWLEETSPDVLFVAEVSPAWRRVLEALSAVYPEQVFSPADEQLRDEWGTALISRVPFVRTRLIPPRADRYRPLIEVELELDGQVVLLRGAHPIRPGEPDAWRRRNLVIATLADEAWPALSILAGDLNTTSTSPVFRDLLAASGLSDSRRGFGRQPSFGLPPARPLLSLAIDHVLLGTALEVLERTTSPVPGSDHAGVVVSFALAGP